MRIITGIILLVLGLIILIFGDRRIKSQEGNITKAFGQSKFRVKLIKWVFGGVLIYLGIVLISNKF